MKALLLTFDVEEFDLPRELGCKLEPLTQIRTTARGLRRILPLLERHKVPATFFVTGEFARHRPDLVAILTRQGHEVGVHGLVHADDYATMPADVALERLRRARAVVQAAAQQTARAVRTPRLRRCAPSILRRAGFDYDASAHPTWVPGRYNGLGMARRPWHEDGVLRIPISVLPAVRLPVSWLWYRLAGERLGGLAARASALGSPCVHLYFHPWEAVPLKSFGIPPLLGLRCGAPFLSLLERLVTNVGTRLRPMTLSDFAQEYEASQAH